MTLPRGFARRVLAFVAFAVVLFVARRAPAHQEERALLDVTELDEQEAFVALRGPSHVKLFAPQACALAPTGEAPEGVRLARLSCPSGLGGEVLSVEGLTGGQVVVARVRSPGGDVIGCLVTEAAPRLTLGGRVSLAAAARRYVRLGATHVGLGLDHVLFLLALAWHARARAGGSLRGAARGLAVLSTAFTVAHSVTLGATALGLLRFPPDLAEALIAWSLVLVALDAPGEGARAWLVGAFGLVHGLGFASGLAEAGLPEGAAVPALVAFNVGVELAQVGLLAGLLASLELVTRLSPAKSVGVSASRLAVGCVGAALFVGRAALVLSPPNP